MVLPFKISGKSVESHGFIAPNQECLQQNIQICPDFGVNPVVLLSSTSLDQFRERIYCLLNVQVLLQFIAGRVPIPVVRLQTKYQTRHAKIKISNYHI